MQRIAVIDSQTSGISGDMLLASLVDLGLNQTKIKDAIFDCQNFLAGSKIRNVDFFKTSSHGFAATSLRLEYTDDFNHRQGIDMYRSLTKCCDYLGLDQRAKIFALETLKTIIAAEATVHGIEPDQVHLDETSSIDTFVDLIGCALALQDLKLLGTKFVSTRIAIGGGTVTFSHGTVYNPTSVILEIFKGRQFMLFGGQAEAEMTTPTGAALLANLATESVCHYPNFMPTMVGYGAGQKIFDHPNILRIVVGETPLLNKLQTDSVCLVETVVDDISGEVIGNLIERLSSGMVKDIIVIPGITKKNRPSNLIRIICDHSKLNSVVTCLFMETGTLGASIQDISRVSSPRSLVTMMVRVSGLDFRIRVKITKGSDSKLVSFKPEFDDVKQVAQQTGLSVKKALELISSDIAVKISGI